MVSVELMNKRELKFMRITDYLPTGKENAISSKALAALLGFDTVRELQRAIERERQSGAVILSTCSDGGGYYLSNDPLEIAAFIRTLHNRANNMLRSVESAQVALNNLTEQEKKKRREE